MIKNDKMIFLLKELNFKLEKCMKFSFCIVVYSL